jgi:hypothetical protein
MRSPRFSLLAPRSTLLLLALLPLLAIAAAPTWWTTRSVLKSGATADDYAATNQGQVRNIAKQAYEEMKARLPSGAGAELDALWASPSASTDDYRAVNLGQLKNLAKPFYARLIALGYTTFYPWDTSTTPADNYAIANLGQVKNLFAFDVAAGFGLALPDSDGNGLADAWEIKWFNHLGVDPSADPDNDGATNFQEYRLGRNPTKGAVADTTSAVRLQLFLPRN